MNNFEPGTPEKINEPDSNETLYRRHRFLVVGLFVSFLACLVALGITGNLFGLPGGILPTSLVSNIADARIALLVMPLLCLICCYALLRCVTHDIMSMPERYLDERQKLVRDEAHRSAYKYIKLACLIVPLLFCLHALFWTAAVPSATFTTIESRPTHPTTLYLIKQSSQHINIHGNKTPAGFYAGEGIIAIEMDSPSYVIHTVHNQPALPVSWPSDPASLLLYYSVLLLALLLIVVALPVSIVAWKERL